MKDSFNNKGIVIDLLSTYRTQLMGLCALLIVACHITICNVRLPNIIIKFLSFGNIGVDIFLLLSGLGIYQSLKRETSSSRINWLIRRYKKLLFPYVCIMLPYWIIYFLKNDKNILNLVFNISTLSYWTERNGVWYLSALVFIYALSPIIYYLIDKFSNKKLLIMVIIIFCIFFGGFPRTITNSFWFNLQFVLKRLPSYLIGMYISNYLGQEKRVSFKYVLICLFLFLLITKLVPQYNCFFLGAFSLSLLLVKLLDYVKLTAVDAFLNFFGIISFEMYLSNHVAMYYLIPLKQENLKMELAKGNYLYYFFVIVLGILISLVSRKLLILNGGKK